MLIFIAANAVVHIHLFVVINEDRDVKHAELFVFVKEDGLVESVHIAILQRLVRTERIICYNNAVATDAVFIVCAVVQIIYIVKAIHFGSEELCLFFCLPSVKCRWVINRFLKLIGDKVLCGVAINNITVTIACTYDIVNSALLINLWVRERNAYQIIYIPHIFVVGKSITVIG